VVDSNDRDRISEARDELHRMLNEVRALRLQPPPCPSPLFGFAPRPREKCLVIKIWEGDPISLGEA